MQYITPHTISNSSVALPYGRDTIHCLIPDKLNAEVIVPQQTPKCNIQDALNNEIENLPRALIAKIAQITKVGIVINDITRPTIHNVLLPLVTHWLKRNDIRITLYVANGLHSAHSLSLLLSAEILANFPVVQHNADNSKLEYCGTTRYNTPVFTNSAFLKEEFKIVIGLIEPHQFMGYTGGAKGAAIGLAGRDTITANHALLTRPQSTLGTLTTNVAREDVEEIGEKIKLDLCIDVLLNPKGEISTVLCGSSRQVMRRAVDILTPLRIAAVNKKYDVVLASAGGWPRDINLYQSQKALAHAANFAQLHAPIILVAQCEEGIGDAVFKHWYTQYHSPNEALSSFKNRPFSIGPHKGYLWARDAHAHPLFLYSHLSEPELGALHVHKVTSITHTLEKITRNTPAQRIAILPFATMVIAHYLEESEPDTQITR